MTTAPSPAVVQALRAARARRYCPHTPHPKQQEFLSCTDREVFYGGAAGGGKSDAILMAALQYVHVPKYSALILRRTYKDLAKPNAIMDRAHTWFRDKDCTWRAKDYTYEFPSSARITFGYLDHVSDRFQYDGAEFQFIGFDELQQFEEICYTYLFSRLRKTEDIDAPLRVRASGMPGDIGHDWVKARFIEGTRKFIPATVEDNPSINLTEYEASLAELDSVTLAQRRFGKWEQDAAGLIYQMGNACKIHTLPAGAWQYIRALDFGIVDRNAIAILGWLPHDQNTYVLSCRYFKGGPADLADELAKDTRKFVMTVGDIGGMGKSFQYDIQLRRKIPIEAAEKSAKLGAIRLINDDLKRGTLKIYAPECGDLLKEYGSLLRKPDGTEYATQDNHCADATLYGWRACPSYLEREADGPKPVVGSKAWEDSEIVKLEREEKRAERSNRGSRWLRRMTG